MPGSSSAASSVTRQSVIADAEADAERLASKDQRQPPATFRDAVHLDAAYAEQHATAREDLRERLYGLFAEDVDDLRRSMARLHTRIDTADGDDSGEAAATAQREHILASLHQSAKGDSWPPGYPAANRAAADGVTMPRGAPPDVIDSASSRDASRSSAISKLQKETARSAAEARREQERQSAPASRQRTPSPGSKKDSRAATPSSSRQSPARPRSAPMSATLTLPARASPVKTAAVVSASDDQQRAMRASRKATAAARKKAATLFKQLRSTNDQQVHLAERERGLIDSLATAFSDAFAMDIEAAASALHEATSGAPPIRSTRPARPAASASVGAPGVDPATGRPNRGGPVVYMEHGRPVEAAGRRQPGGTVLRQRPVTKHVPSFVEKRSRASAATTAPRRGQKDAPQTSAQPRTARARAASQEDSRRNPHDQQHRRLISRSPPRGGSSGFRSLSHQRPVTFFQERQAAGTSRVSFKIGAAK